MSFLIRSVMTSVALRKFKARWLLAARFIWRRKGLWLRAILSWLIGMIFILADREPDYDFRLQLRGAQPTDQQIVLVMITQSEWEKWLGTSAQNISYLKESNYFKSSYYWEPKAWEKLLGTLIEKKPAAIGVSPYFGENIPRPPLTVRRSPIFTHPKVVWSAQMDEEGHIRPSRFAKTYSRSTGLNEHMADRDGIIRRLGHMKEQIPHFAVQLARRLDSLKNYDWSELSTPAPRVINFRGPQGSFSQIRLSDVISNRYSPNFFKNKIVIIGTQDDDGFGYRTPVGKMSRAEIVANILDNIKNDRWITRPNVITIGLLISTLVLFVAWITSRYPQFLAFFIILCGNLFYITFSIWIFDAYYFWLPVSALVITSMLTYFMFLSFQLTLKEYLNVQLENERRFLLEVEELKNNFLSLISHDLKTPIAKIQAICDRLLMQYPDHALSPDLVSLREVASELHHYIRTILQITRVESRDFRISKDAMDLNEIVQAVIAQLDPLAKNKKIVVEAELEPMFLIELDAMLIHEVILNLVDNAIKYTPEGGRVKVSTREVDDQVILMVEDTGPGISTEEQSRIFEKFYRGELGKMQPKGSGLGLYLVKYFVELHKGKVLLESSPDTGTKVGFSLPIGDAIDLEENNLNADALGEEKYAT